MVDVVDVNQEVGNVFDVEKSITQEKFYGEVKTMKITVLGATGMLGHVVAKYMTEAYGVENVVRSSRSRAQWTPLDDAKNEKWIEFPLPMENDFQLCWIPPDTDYVINCIGVIKPFVDQAGIVDTIYINSIFPHVLAEYCEQQGIRLIHITTDCVFSGYQVMGEYIELDEHDVTDIYGRTKSLGEPKNKAMVLRTSIIGREIHKQASLVAWVQSQAGKEVNGFTNHTWNGITTKTYAKCCQQIIDFDMYEEGIYHIFSPSPVTKCQLVTMISNALDLGVKVNPTEAPRAIHRTLSTIHSLCENLYISELFEQLKEL